MENNIGLGNDTVSKFDMVVRRWWEDIRFYFGWSSDGVAYGVTEKSSHETNYALVAANTVRLQ